MKSITIAPALAVSLVLSMASGIANAATFGVRVVDDGGAPVVGASVCLGLPGNYKQFGALFTDAEGQAAAEVPNIPFVVTVSKTRFSGVRLSEPARGFNLIKQVTLSEGVPGPRCKAGSTLAENNESSIQILAVDVSVNGGTVVMTPLATGGPTDYRLSSSTDFLDAGWQNLSNSFEVPATLANLDIIYLQMRRYTDFDNGWLETQSAVSTVLLPIREQSSSL